MISNLPNHAHVVSIRDYLMNLSKELHDKIESKVTTPIYISNAEFISLCCAIILTEVSPLVQSIYLSWSQVGFNINQ